MKKIEITIDEEGNITVETSGFSGQACLKETEKLIAELGTVVSTKKKPEFYATTCAKVKA